MEKKILIIDDDDRLQSLLKEYLEGYSYSIVSLASGDNVLQIINEENPNIIILDIMLPGKDGLEILKEIRDVSETPVIMLTARGEDTDRVVGLEMGADDYLTKPFNPRELLARIKAVLRRIGNPPPERSLVENTYIEAGGLRLDSLSMTIAKEDKKIVLSKTEFKILEALMKRPSRVISRDELMNIARGRDFIAFERSIDVHVSKLRVKVESISGFREQIKTVWGSGYMFVEKV